jgi:hypothetical protein
MDNGQRIMGCGALHRVDHPMRRFAVDESLSVAEMDDRRGLYHRAIRRMRDGRAVARRRQVATLVNLLSVPDWNAAPLPDPADGQRVVTGARDAPADEGGCEVACSIWPDRQYLPVTVCASRDGQRNMTRRGCL